MNSAIILIFSYYLRLLYLNAINHVNGYNTVLQDRNITKLFFFQPSDEGNRIIICDGVLFD